MATRDEIDTMYYTNADTVQEIGSRLGFKLHSFNPDWSIYYEYPHRKVKDAPDELMECIAKIMNLPWKNRYNSHLTTVCLDRALKQRNLEENGYQVAWIASRYISHIKMVQNITSRMEG